MKYLPHLPHRKNMPYILLGLNSRQVLILFDMDSPRIHFHSVLVTDHVYSTGVEYIPLNGTLKGLEVERGGVGWGGERGVTLVDPGFPIQMQLGL